MAGMVNYIYMWTVFCSERGEESDYMDVRIYRTAEDSRARIQDEFFHLFLGRARQYEIPRHVDILVWDPDDPDDPGMLLSATAHFKDLSSLCAFIREETVFEAEINDVDIDSMEGKANIPHYAVDLSRGTNFIHDTEYTADNYYDYLEEFLKGEVE